MKILTHEWHQSKGATFEDFYGVDVPSHYGNPEKEYRALRKSVGIRDVSYFGKIRMTGKDRHRFLNGMVSNDVKTLQPGKGVLALFLDVKGHIQADMKIYAFPDHFLITLQHYVRDKIIAGLDRYIISEDVQMKDVTQDFAFIQVLGPESESFLRSKGIERLPSDLYSFEQNEIGQVIRLSVGYSILTDNGSSVLDLLDAQPVGMRAFDTYRVESGLALVQRDTEEMSFPQEARMDAALNFQKGCYLGQEVMARIDAQGHVNKRLMGIVSETAVHSGDKIYQGDKEVGKVMSTTFSILLQQPFSIGYVRREHANEGQEIQIGESRTTGVVRNLPL
jgi:folate-binding protein YgfZ